MQQNVFLIGFMGSGKSHWGKIWARKNNLSYFDLDNEIEKAFGLTVSEIFETHGEEKFRAMEKLYLRKFEHKKGFLLSCGGGTPCFFDNLDWMKKIGKVIFLKAGPGFLLNNVLLEIEKRPLLKGSNQSELLFFIQKKLKEREPVYEKAHYVLQAGQLTDDSLSNLPGKANELKSRT